MAGILEGIFLLEIKGFFIKGTNPVGDRVKNWTRNLRITTSVS